MIARDLQARLVDLASWYPVVPVTGPRQSGKSTLVRATFPNHRYLNLEDPAVRARALADPSGFIADNPGPLIIDEAQYAPELFSAVQAAADAAGQTGRYVLTGSQNFLMMRGIKQSLAGRVGMAKLLPLSAPEIEAAGGTATLPELIHRGSYPQLQTARIPTGIFFENYVETYVTRDAVGLFGVRSEAAFRTFMGLCAARAGNLLNVSALAAEAGVSVPTARSWLSLLEASYIVRLVQPYHANLAKRLTKTPKLYFYDTGLLCHFLGFRTPGDLVASESYGAVYENYVIAERLKRHFNHLATPSVFFYRDDSKIEVDLVDTTEPVPLLAEIKSGQTYSPAFCRHVRSVDAELGLGARKVVVYGGAGSFQDGDVDVRGIREWLRE